MTREEAQKIIEALVALREEATDEMALKVPVLYPAWREGVEYKQGKRVLRDGVLYTVLIDHTSQADWTPETSPSLFAKVLIPDENTIPAWQQPDSTNTYKKGDKVTHNGKTWVSDLDSNSWEPGAYGWTEIPAEEEREEM